MVWEEVVEGGITRYVAVYHSTVPGEIGPVRSVRPMDPAIAAPLHGLFAFSGGQRAGAGTPAVEADGTPMRDQRRRPAGRRREHQRAGRGGQPGARDADGRRGRGPGRHRWEDAGRQVDAPVALTAPDGSPVPLAPGTTWVELVPNRTGSVTVG
ncbi:DUF3048 domain-containing protein [Blastococcus sp. HT6-30]|uniref:DUF3048 domain-containing protein n=1 Tax=Blastococcus sp. HT6-30 TaxID=3144843 RepID=UPI003219F48D